MPELKVSRAWAEAMRAVHSVEPSEQDAPERLPGETETGLVAEPLQKRVSPATEVIMGMLALGLKLAERLSAMRPAQPVGVAPLWEAFCHSSC